MTGNRSAPLCDTRSNTIKTGVFAVVTGFMIVVAACATASETGSQSLARPATAKAVETDYAESRHVDQWLLRHPVYGDPSFDSFERQPGNPIHRGKPPFEWRVNGSFFVDPVGGKWHISPAPASRHLCPLGGG